MTALAITSLLMVAATAAVANLARAQAAQTKPLEKSLLDAGLRRLLETDLAHAQQYRPLANGFELRTWAALDPDRLELSHLPVTVRYEVQAAGSRGYLVRTQQAPGGKPAGELVCPAVRSCAMSPARPAPAPALSQWTDIPWPAAITVAFDESASPGKAPGRNPLVLVFGREP